MIDKEVYTSISFEIYMFWKSISENQNIENYRFSRWLTIGLLILAPNGAGATGA